MEITYNNRHDVTFINVDEFTYTWTIINFRDSMKKCLKLLESPAFTVGHLKNEMYLNLTDFSSISSHLHLSFGHRDRFQIFPMHYIASVVDKNGHEQFIHEKTIYDYPRLNSYYLHCYPNFDKFVEKNFLHKNNVLLPNGNLTIRCTFYYNQNSVNIENPIKFFDEKKQSCQQEVSEYFEELFETGKFSDVELVVEDKTFNAHKNILAMRSTVFSAMFEHKMKEQRENLVEITDIKYDVMKEVLRYIYTKKINDFSTLGKDIFIAADKYAIDGLKNYCEQKFIVDLSIENVPELLIFVDKYNVNNLKKCIFEFLRVTATDIIIKKLFEKLLIPNSLILEVIEALSLK